VPDEAPVVCGGGLKPRKSLARGAKAGDSISAISVARARLHKALAKDTLVFVGAENMPTNADKDNKLSVNIATVLAKSLGAVKSRSRPAGQTLGTKFEQHCQTYLTETFHLLGHLRPGKWRIGSGKSIAQFAQYAHLLAIDKVLNENPGLKASLGGDYIIKPDIVIGRMPEEDSVINDSKVIVDDTSANYAVLRKKSGAGEMLHASISCKWTIRSDRVQNARAEALNLIRNRKGHLPHVVAVTAEPLPSRLASLCYGTGDLNCVYHVALPELVSAVAECRAEDALSTLKELVDGGRLKDISDLPLDLAV
jgi:NgoMIV restriction enzyme